MNDAVSKGISDALSAIIAERKAMYHAQFDESDNNHRLRRDKLANLMQAMEEIKRQTVGIDHLDISPAPHGHMASIRAGSRRLSLSTDYDNKQFTIEESDYSSWTGDSMRDITHRFDSEEEVLRFILQTVAGYIALEQALAERKK